ncbi:hypothetical protein J3R30DRAFT_3537485 [Lentinula aciculospora]|uniref:Uncharacterized protein n=1 Tax=Lentinula aciculospora TaxID=153920 RepID=A0A9W9DI45_9AGAR|nr:hypothetical protein J3R30DRAFT_3537485 [Lentinula aciculospora]
MTKRGLCIRCKINRYRYSDRSKIYDSAFCLETPTYTYIFGTFVCTMLSTTSHHNPFHIKSSRHCIELVNADISRLMDPSYHTSTNYGVSSTEPAKAYIDHRGQLHDPDFHYFPVYQGVRGRRRSRISTGDEDEGEGEEEDGEEGLVETDSRQYHRRHGGTRLSPSHIYPISSSDSYHSSSSTSSSPSTTSSPLPCSEDKRRRHHSIVPKQFRRHSSDESERRFTFDTVFDALDFEDAAEEQEQEPIAQNQNQNQGLSASTYSQTMKKQWLAVSLSLRFRLLRARRRASSGCRSKTS